MLRIWLTGKKNGTFTLPDLSVLYSIDSLIAILKEIENSHLQDRKAHDSLLRKWPLSDLSKSDSYDRREIWRMGSYIIFALNIDGVISRVHEEMSELYRSISGPTNLLVEQKQTDAQIEIYRRYRNKIFAHTAFGYPRNDDNISTRHTTLAIISRQIGGKTSKEHETTLGGISIALGNEKAIDFPTVSFKGMVIDFTQHFIDWHKHLKNIVIKITSAEDLSIEKNLRKNNEFESIRIDRSN